MTGAAVKAGPPLSYAELAKAAANKNGAGGASAAPAPTPAPAAATAEAGRAADAVEKPAASAPKADREATAEGDAKSAPAADAATKDTGSPKVRPSLRTVPTEKRPLTTPNPILHCPPHPCEPPASAENLSASQR